MIHRGESARMRCVERINPARKSCPAVERGRVGVTMASDEPLLQLIGLWSFVKRKSIY